jgi:hypothetical protein
MRWKDFGRIPLRTGMLGMPRAALTSRGASLTATADDINCAATNVEYFMMFSLEM